MIVSNASPSLSPGEDEALDGVCSAEKTIVLFFLYFFRIIALVRKTRGTESAVTADAEPATANSLLG